MCVIWHILLWKKNLTQNTLIDHYSFKNLFQTMNKVKQHKCITQISF